MAITLKAARVNAGLTQREVSEKLNISKATLSHYETYKTIPDMEIGAKLAKLYGLTVDDIIFFR